MSGSSQSSQAGESDPAESGTAPDTGIRPQPGSGHKPGRLRRRLLGYRPEDVGDELASKLEGEIASRDADVDEMRRDIAALWLAFGQHERRLRGLAGRLEAAVGPLMPPSPAPPGATPASSSSPAPAPAEPGSPGPEPVPISEQLSDLDDVLAAIERATEVLERTHSDEIQPAKELDGPEEPDEPQGAEKPETPGD